MRRNPSFGLMMITFAGLLGAGCGDNSKECGVGTVDMGGVCTPSASCGPGTKAGTNGTCVPDGSVVCTDGTIFDMTTGHCAIDPMACQGDTVLIDGKCQDPTAGLHVDVEEGAEPNGLGIGGEASQAPAGIVALNPAGGAAFVVHGKIVPADHNGDGVLDNDYDTYVVTVTAPSLIAVTADGVHGLTGGFVALANVASGDPLASYQRFGLNLTGDTAKRQLFLPAAGTYLLTIADSRTLFLNNAVAGAEPGLPAFEYFVSINTLAIPAAATLAVATNVATSPTGDTLGSDVKFFTTPMGNGLSEAALAFQSGSAVAAIQVLDNNAFRTLGTGQDLGNGINFADVSVGGFAPTDVPTFVVDFVYNYSIEPFLYQLQVTSNTAQALSTTGAKVTDPAHSTFPVAPGDYNQFYFDVAAADDTIGLAMTFDAPYDAALVDSNNQVIANFTWSGGQAIGDTMTAYNGLLRMRTAGRYYFMVYDPNNGAGTIGVTSKLATLTPAAVVTGTPLAAQPVSVDYRALPFTYATNRATTPWQFLTSTANTGMVVADFYDPASAYGRLDPVRVNGAPRGAEATPMYSSPQVGRIMLDDPTDTLYVHVRPNTAPPGRTVTLNYRARVFHDFATVAAGTPVAPVTGETTSAAANPPKFYLVKSAAGNRVTITATPTGATAATDNLLINLLRPNESARKTINTNTTPGTGESTDTFVPVSGWIAFSVTTTRPSSTFTLALAVTAPTTYTNTLGTTAYADACAGGTNRSLNGDTDEGSTNPIAAPASFKLFGVPVTSFVVGANGLLAFVGDPATEPTFINEPLPAVDFATSGMVAPFWTDLYNVTVCTKTVAGKLVVQWTGSECTTFSSATGCGGTTVVNTQAILDGATSTIELVYGPGQQGDGSVATVGIEDTESSAADQVSFDTAGSVAPSTSRLLTPN